MALFVVDSEEPLELSASKSSPAKSDDGCSQADHSGKF